MAFRLFRPPQRFMAVLWLCLMPILAYSQVSVERSLQQGLIAHWKFEGNAKDEMGNHDGTAKGNVRYVEGQDGLGLAASFEGGYIEVANPDLFRASEPNFSFSAWVLFRDNSTGDRPIISMARARTHIPLPKINLAKCGSNRDSHRTGPRPKCLGHLHVRVTNHKRTQVPGGHITKRAVPLSRMDGSQIAGAGWLHVVGIVDSSNKNAKIYVNGELQSTQRFDQFHSDFKVQSDKVESGYAVHIGAYPHQYPPETKQPNGASHRHNGLIDDLRIYGRVLSQQEIRMIMNRPPSPPTGLIVQQAGNPVETIEFPYDNVKLSWQPSTDPEGQPIKYTTSLSCNSPTPTPLAQCQNLAPTSCTVDASLFDYDQFCFWSVAASDGMIATPSEIVQFRTSREPPPHTPNIPQLTNGGVNVPAPYEDVDSMQEITLSWQGGDPNPEDTVSYEVVFADGENPCQETFPADTLTCTIPANQLEMGKTYSWQVIAKDNDGSLPSEPAPFWRFSTAPNEPPAPVTGGIIKQGGNVIDVDNGEVIWTNSDITFEWQPTTDKENENILYQLCYVNLADFDLKAAVEDLTAEAKEGEQNNLRCIPPYAENLSVTLDADEPKNRLDAGANYAWIVSAQDESGNKSDWEIWEFSTKPADPAITLLASGGHQNTLLDWKLEGNDSEIVRYRVLRTEKVNNMSADSFDSVAHAITTTELYNYSDDDAALQPGTEYCYRIDALDERDNTLYHSAFNEGDNCVKFGTTTIGIEDQTVKQGDTIEVPVLVPNGGDLKIHTATLCAGYNGDVLDIVEPKATPYFHNDYRIQSASVIDGFDSVSAGLPEEVNRIIKVILEYSSRGTPPTLEELEEDYGLVGPLSLFNLQFQAKQNVTTADSSILLLLDVADNSGLNPTPEHASVAGVIQDAKNCGIVRELLIDDTNQVIAEPVIIDFNNRGRITLERKGTRDGKGPATRIFVRNEYGKGDVSGDGYVSGIDGFMADGIALGDFNPTAKQLMAGTNVAIHDTTMYNITAADVKAIYDYADTQNWLANTTHVRSGLRDSKPDKPMLFSLADVSANSGATITIKLDVSNLVGLAAFSSQIFYDPAVIANVESVALSTAGIVGDTPVSFSVHKTQPGLINFMLYTNGNAQVQGSGHFVDFTFKLADATRTKRTALHIGKTQLYDRYGRNFVTSKLEAQLQKRHGSITLLDVPESQGAQSVAVPLKDLLPEQQESAYAISALAIDLSNQAMPNVTIAVNGETVSTDENGYAIIFNLAPGTYTLTATQTGHTFFAQTCTVGDGQNCSVTFKSSTVIPPGTYEARGQVTDQAGSPVAGATVTIAGKTATTDVNGDYRIKGLTEGEYLITASKDGYQFPRKTCEVGNDENCEVNTQAGSLLSLHVSVDPRRPYQGDNVTYTFTLHNQGTQTATGIRLDLPLPDNTTLLSLQSDSGIACEATVCTLSELAAGASVSLTLVIANELATKLTSTFIAASNEYPTDVVTKTVHVIPYFSIERVSRTEVITKGDSFSLIYKVAVNTNAPEIAQNIQFKTELPRGYTLLNISEPNCDTSNLPTLMCDMGTLSVGHSREVQLDLRLDDFYALWASHRAVVNADNYPADSAAIQTEVYLGDAKVDIIVAIDVTGSMHDEIEALEAVITQLEATLANTSTTQPMIAVVSFRDDIYLEAATPHLDEVKTAVSKMEAQGGGACPEASYEAMMLAVQHAKTGGTVLLVTDAPPYPDVDMNALITAINDKNLDLVVIQPETICAPVDDWQFQ